MHLNESDISQLVTQMAAELRTQLGEDLAQAVMIGIQTGGHWVAERLHQSLGLDEPLGSLSTRLYRDDFTTLGLHPKITPSSLPAPIEGRHVILVDDVLYTGRTIRAAMNELFDNGRPASIKLAVLVDRGGHELPIAADVVGKTLLLPHAQRIKLSGPDPLKLDILQGAE
jgi:pyrimidine operon attenuation protein / uracil phosphoribosyltransferase